MSNTVAYPIGIPGQAWGDAERTQWGAPGRRGVGPLG